MCYPYTHTYTYTLAWEDWKTPQPELCNDLLFSLCSEYCVLNYTAVKKDFLCRSIFSFGTLLLYFENNIQYYTSFPFFIAEAQLNANPLFIWAWCWTTKTVESECKAIVLNLVEEVDNEQKYGHILSQVLTLTFTFFFFLFYIFRYISRKFLFLKNIFFLKCVSFL